MALSEAQVLDALRVVQDPDLHRDIVALGFVKHVRIDGGRVGFTVELTTPACPVKDLMRDQARSAVSALPGVTQVDIEMTAQVRAVGRPEAGRAAVDGVKNIIAVGAGKGGVGKTTVAVNLAVALAKAGSRVALLDGDMYGPNIPIMLGFDRDQRLEQDGQKILPAEKYGVQAVSMGFLTADDAPVIWRGPMLHGAIQQFFRDVKWDNVDYLVVDMPPGTGDIQLTLSQRVPVTGAVIVTTPQDIALLDAKKGVAMFEKVGVPILGVVENMAVHVCEKCGHVEHIFGSDGGKKMAKQYQLDYLGALPLNLSIREQADRGFPTVAAEPDGEIAALYKSVARQVAVKIAEKAKDFSSKFPTITVSKNT